MKISCRCCTYTFLAFNRNIPCLLFITTSIIFWDACELNDLVSYFLLVKFQYILKGWFHQPLVIVSPFPAWHVPNINNQIADVLFSLVGSFGIWFWMLSLLPPPYPPNSWQMAIRSSVLGATLAIAGTRSPCSRVPAFSKHLEKGIHQVAPAFRVAMDTSLLHIAFGIPLTFKAPVPKLI